MVYALELGDCILARGSIKLSLLAFVFRANDKGSSSESVKEIGLPQRGALSESKRTVQRIIQVDGPSSRRLRQQFLSHILHSLQVRSRSDGV